MRQNRIVSSIASALALFAVSVAAQPSLAQAPPAPGGVIGNSFPPNMAVGGRTLGLDAICGNCQLEKYSVCTGRVEGPTFDKEGNLWIVGLDTKDIYRVTKDGVCTSVAKTPGPNGLRFHKDGRLFGTDHAAGLFWMDTNTHNITWITNKFGDGNFHGANDLIFDKAGGLYFSDARGSGEFVKRGQLFYRTPEGVVTRLADNLSYPNGLVLSPAEDRLYVAEWGSNRIAAFPIRSPGVIDLESGWIFTYLNSGRGPDGMTMDEAGNLYAAHHSAGEVLVFNPRGFLYGAIKMPDDSMVPNNVQFHEGYLYITEADQHTVWRVKTKIPGIKHFQDQ